jgi:putative salt-induced outer membrane protein
MKTLATLLSLTVLSASATAEDGKSKWTGEADVSALFTSGNTSQTSFGVGGKAAYTSGKFAHKVSAFADFNKSNGLKDRERFGFGYNLNYDFSDKVFLSLDSAYESNKFGAFRERFAFAGGVGYRVKNSDALKWTIEAAPSLLYTKATEDAEYETDFSGFVRNSVDWQITETTKFTNVSSAYFGGKSIVENKAAVSFKIMDALSSKLSYDILYDKDAPVGRKTTDTVLRAGLSYGF